MIALTDALEQPAHPAHRGALHYGSSYLCSSTSGQEPFLVRSIAVGGRPFVIASGPLNMYIDNE